MNLSYKLIQTIRKIPKLLHGTCVFCFLDNVNIIHISTSDWYIKSSIIIIHDKTEIESQIHSYKIKNKSLISIDCCESNISQIELNMILKNLNIRSIQLILKKCDSNLSIEIIWGHLSNPRKPMQILKSDLTNSP